MKQIPFGKTGLQVPAIVMGAMRLGDKTPAEMNRFIHAAWEQGANFWDHADIYGGGRCESLFGEALAGDSSIRREDLILQSKCGIRPGRYDQSKEYILAAVDSILRRLRTDYLDVLLLHRPDALVEPEEVAEAFDALARAGKVRHFGVSNHKPMQIELLKKAVRQPIVANQMQFSLAAATMVANGLEVNMPTPGAVDRDGSVLDYCRVQDITLQAWSPFQREGWQGCFIDDAAGDSLNERLAALAEQYGVSKTTLAAAWILRHPAQMQLVAGTASEQRLGQIIAACDVPLTREDWYALYLAAGNPLP